MTALCDDTDKERGQGERENKRKREGKMQEIRMCV